MTQRLQEAENELKLSNEKHTIMIEKYKKDFTEMKSKYVEDSLKLEKVLEEASNNYSEELEKV